MKKQSIKAIYPGSFDPLTLGHCDIIERAACMYDTLYVGISTNINKTPLFTIEERVEMAREALSGVKNVVVESFNGLLAEHVRDLDVKYVVRGLRAISDFEYEFQLALMNRTLNADMETVFLMPSQKYIFLSSTMIRDIARHGGDISLFVTPNVRARLLEKYSPNK